MILRKLDRRETLRRRTMFGNVLGERAQDPVRVGVRWFFCDDRCDEDFFSIDDTLKYVIVVMAHVWMQLMVPHQVSMLRTLAHINGAVQRHYLCM